MQVFNLGSGVRVAGAHMFDRATVPSWNGPLWVGCCGLTTNHQNTMMQGLQLTDEHLEVIQVLESALVAPALYEVPVIVL